MEIINEMSFADLHALEWQLGKIESKFGMKVLPDDPNREYKLSIKDLLDKVSAQIRIRIMELQARLLVEHKELTLTLDNGEIKPAADGKCKES